METNSTIGEVFLKLFLSNVLTQSFVRISLFEDVVNIKSSTSPHLMFTHSISLFPPAPFIFIDWPGSYSRRHFNQVSHELISRLDNFPSASVPRISRRSVVEEIAQRYLHYSFIKQLFPRSFQSSVKLKRKRKFPKTWNWFRRTWAKREKNSLWKT